MMFILCSDQRMKRTDPPHPAPKFKPVPVRARHDGWTPGKQFAFIDALAASGCIEEACRSVGMTAQSAYRLHNRPDAEGFRAAWQGAMEVAIGQLEHRALSRSIHGVETPVFFKGEQIGVRRRYDERLTQFLLRSRRPEIYGAVGNRGDWPNRSPEVEPAVFNYILFKFARLLFPDEIPERFAAMRAKGDGDVSSPSSLSDGEEALDRWAQSVLKDGLSPEPGGVANGAAT